MNVALDTNVLAYVEGLNGAPPQRAALDLVAQLRPDTTFIPVQMLGELLAVLVRKAGRARRAATSAVLGWGDACPLVETSPDRQAGVTWGVVTVVNPFTPQRHPPLDAALAAPDSPHRRPRPRRRRRAESE